MGPCAVREVREWVDRVELGLRFAEVGARVLVWCQASKARYCELRGGPCIRQVCAYSATYVSDARCRPCVRYAEWTGAERVQGCAAAAPRSEQPCSVLRTLSGAADPLRVHPLPAPCADLVKVAAKPLNQPVQQLSRQAGQLHAGSAVHLLYGCVRDGLSLRNRTEHGHQVCEHLRGRRWGAK